MRIPRNTSQHRPQPVSLKFGSGMPALLKTLDYTTLGASTVGQNQLIYGTVIGSRLWQSRSPNEFKENARRDILGWYNWFMGSPLMQTAIVLWLLPKNSQNLLLTRLGQDVQGPRKILTALFNPSGLWKIASDEQLCQREAHIVSALKKTGASDKISRVHQLIQTSRNHRALMSVFGLAYTFFALGVGINLLNIALTKAAVRKEDQ